GCPSGFCANRLAAKRIAWSPAPQEAHLCIAAPHLRVSPGFRSLIGRLDCGLAGVPHDPAWAAPHPTSNCKEEADARVRQTNACTRKSWEAAMNEKIESFSKELHPTLDGMDKRLKDLTASAKRATEKAKVEAKAQLAALESRAKQQHAKVQSAEARTKAWLEEKKTATS